MENVLNGLNELPGLIEDPSAIAAMLAIAGVLTQAYRLKVKRKLEELATKYKESASKKRTWVNEITERPFSTILSNAFQSGFYQETDTVFANSSGQVAHEYGEQVEGVNRVIRNTQAKIQRTIQEAEVEENSVGKYTGHVSDIDDGYYIGYIPCIMAVTGIATMAGANAIDSWLGTTVLTETTRAANEVALTTGVAAILCNLIPAARSARHAK